MARPPRRPARPKPGINNLEKKFFEEALSALPIGPLKGGEGYAQADGLLKFGYHQNPYIRTFTKLLWSTYALSRGQIADSHERFKQAHRDAQMSNIDEVTVRALDEAAHSLERAMAPDGSVTIFLKEMRNNTIRRVWARVCETSMLPPPSFRTIFASDEEGPSEEELEAAEAAEIAALMINQKTEDGEAEGESEGAPKDEAGEETAAPQLEATLSPAPDDGPAPQDSPLLVPAKDADDAPAPAVTRADRPAQDGDDDAGRVPRAENRESQRENAGENNADKPSPQTFAIKQERACAVELAPETLAALAAELLKELRVNQPSGELRIILSVEGQGVERKSRRRGRRRRR